MAAKATMQRIDREKRTFEYMLRIYCHAHHGTVGQLCSDCQLLLQNARKRLEKCPFGSTKPTCGKCPHNCHPPTERAMIRKIMGFSGPRMLWHHPLLALLHLWDSRGCRLGNRGKSS